MTFMAGYDAALATQTETPSFQIGIKEYTPERKISASEMIIDKWLNGDWHVTYKGKEYHIPMAANINKMLEWINKKNSEAK